MKFLKKNIKDNSLNYKKLIENGKQKIAKWKSELENPKLTKQEKKGIQNKISA